MTLRNRGEAALGKGNVMVIQQALQPALVRAIEFNDPGKQRRARAATLAIAVSIAAHLILGFYVYEARYAIKPPATDVRGVVLSPPILIKPPAPVKHITQPPPPAHRPADASPADAADRRQRRPRCRLRASASCRRRSSRNRRSRGSPR